MAVYTNFIALPRNDRGNSFAGAWSTIQGFGRYSDNSQNVSNEKRWVSMPIMSNGQCQQTWGVGDGNLCTDTAGGRDACNGLFYIFFKLKNF